ncbi:hypothetical protein N2152v2_003921 [Parachlorella kessleri]
MPALVQQGKTLRWCQQCGRFQGLDEFDGDRKTCRAVLERHNARRRKRTAEQAGARKAGTPPVPPSTTSSSGTKRASPASTSSRQAAAGAAAGPPVSDSSQDNGQGGGSDLGGLSAGSGGGGGRTSPFDESPAGGEQLLLLQDPSGAPAWPWPQQQAAAAMHHEPPLSRAGSAWESMQPLPSCSSLEERPADSCGPLMAAGSQQLLAALQQQEQQQQQRRTGSPSTLPGAAAGAPSYHSGAAVETAYQLGDQGGQLAGEAGGELTLLMVEELMGDTDLKDTLGVCDLSVPEVPLLEPAQLDNDLLSLLDRPFSSCPLPSRQDPLEAAASAQGQAWQQQQQQQQYHHYQQQQHQGEQQDPWLHHLPLPELALQPPSATVPLLHAAATAPSPFSSTLPPAAAAPGWPSPVSSALPATSVAAVPSPFSSTVATPASTALPAAAGASPFSSSMSAGPAGASPFASALSAPTAGLAGPSPFASTLPAAAADLAAPSPFSSTLPALAAPAVLAPLPQQQPLVPDFPVGSDFAAPAGHMDFGTALSFPLAHQQQRQHYGQQQYQRERQYRSLQLLQQLQREQQQYLSHQRHQRQQLQQQQQAQHVHAFTSPSSWDGYSSIDSSNSWPATGGLSVASLTTLHSWPLVEQAGPGAAEQQHQPGAQAAADRQQEYLVRLSLKLFNVQPEELPDGVRQDVAGLIATDPALVETFVRPGCTHVTIMGLVGPADWTRLRKLGAQGVASQLLESGGWLLPAAAAEAAGGQGAPQGQAWAEEMLVQLDDDVVVVKGGRLAHIVSACSLAPQLLAARPAALLAQPLSHYEVAAPRPPAASCAGTAAPEPAAAARKWDAKGAATDAGSTVLPAVPGVVTLWGYRVSGSHDVIICRQQGRVLDLEILARGKLPHAARRSGRAPEWVLVRPLACSPGLLQFEVQRGGLLSQTVGVAALPTPEAVAEAKRAQRVLAGAKGASQAFLQGLGLVVQQHHQQQQGFQAEPHPLLAALAARLLAAARQHGWSALAELLALVAASAAAVNAVPAVAEAAPVLVAAASDAAGELAESAGKASPTQSARSSVVRSVSAAGPDADIGTAAALDSATLLDRCLSLESTAEGLPNKGTEAAQPAGVAYGASSEATTCPAPAPSVADGSIPSPPNSGGDGASNWVQLRPAWELTAVAGKRLSDCGQGVDDVAGCCADTMTKVYGSSLTAFHSVAECAKVGGDYAKWVAQQMSTVGAGGSHGLGSATGAQFHACVAMLAAATGATLLLRNVLGEVQ